MLLGVLDTLIAEVALVGVFDLHCLSERVVREDLSRALADELLLLLNIKGVYLVLIQLYDGFGPHQHRRNWRPLGVNLTDALLGNQFKIEHLIL